jgi:hypothetical protein
MLENIGFVIEFLEHSSGGQPFMMDKVALETWLLQPQVQQLLLLFGRWLITAIKSHSSATNPLRQIWGIFRLQPVASVWAVT